MKFKISSFLENENYNFNKENILKNLPEKYIDDAVNTITTWDNYKPTNLKNLDLLAKEYSIKNIYYKDEGERFDLKSFKKGATLCISALDGLGTIEHRSSSTFHQGFLSHGIDGAWHHPGVQSFNQITIENLWLPH